MNRSKRNRVGEHIKSVKHVLNKRPKTRQNPIKKEKQKNPSTLNNNMLGFCNVGETGFEPATLRSQSECATGLRYSPEKCKEEKYGQQVDFAISFSTEIFCKLTKFKMSYQKTLRI